MVLIYFIAVIVALAGGFAGSQPFFRVEKINKRNLLNTLLIVIIIFTLLMTAYYMGYFPQSVAAPFMMSVYSFFAGFFAGYAWRLILLKSRGGNILYMHRSFWIDHAPNIAAILIVLYGLYRTSILLDHPVTGIRLTSGLSLVAFGFFGWTLKIVPEFRSRGILFLDHLLSWRQVIGWRWHSEEVLNIDYLHHPGEADEEVRELFTSIPPDERKQIETILESKMEEHREERRQMLLDKRNY